MNLVQLRTFARQKADEELTGYIGDPELNRYLNQGLHFVYDKIVQRFENYFIRIGTALNGGLFNTVVGTTGYALPVDMLKLVKAEQRQFGSTDEDSWRKLDTLNIGNDRLSLFYPERLGYGPGTGFGYFIAGNTLYFRPAPKTAFEVRLWDIPFVTEMVIDADIPGIPIPYHSLLAEYGAIQMLAKSGERLFQERSATFKQDLEAMLESIETRNQQPEQMIITEDDAYDRNGFVR